jgi:hypothetical protein
MPLEGSVITLLVDGGMQAGFVFRSAVSESSEKKGYFVVCYADRSWEGIAASSEVPWSLVAAGNEPADLPSGVIHSPKGCQLPEGFLYGRQQIDSTGWVTFSQFVAGGPVVAGHDFGLPRLQGLQAGQHVECTGKVRGECTDPIFIALAQAREPAAAAVQKPHWRRFAVVACSTSGALSIAQVLGMEEGYVKPTDPLSYVPSSVLMPLQAQVSSFLARQKVATLCKAFARALAPPSQLQLRTRVQPSHSRICQHRSARLCQTRRRLLYRLCHTI